MIANEEVIDAACCEMAMLSQLAQSDDNRALVALAEMKMFVARLDEAVKNPPSLATMKDPASIPAIVRDGYTIRTDKRSGFQVFEMHNPEPEDADTGEERTPLDVFENLKPERMVDVVVLLRDENGQTAVTSNMTEPGDILLFMEILKTKMLSAISATPDPPSLGGA